MLAWTAAKDFHAERTSRKSQNLYLSKLVKTKDNIKEKKKKKNKKLYIYIYIYIYKEYLETFG